MASTERVLLRCSNADQIFQRSADRFLELAAQAIDQRGRFLVALAGGSTPKGLYARLSAAKPSFDWHAIEWFWGDERAVAPTHADSNYRMARETLLAPIQAPADRIHRMPADASDLDRAAEDYQRLLIDVAGSGSRDVPPALDLILLGMGNDGHTASLFPHNPGLSVVDRWVASVWAPHLSAHRMTMTIPMINQASEIHFLVEGAAKAETLSCVLEGPEMPDALPAQRIRLEHGELRWYIDAAAGSQLANLT